jgi:hypothetical protein
MKLCCNTKCRLCWVLQTTPLRWVSLRPSMTMIFFCRRNVKSTKCHVDEMTTPHCFCTSFVPIWSRILKNKLFCLLRIFKRALRHFDNLTLCRTTLFYLPQPSTLGSSHSFYSFAKLKHSLTTTNSNKRDDTRAEFSTLAVAMCIRCVIMKRNKQTSSWKLGQINF